MARRTRSVYARQQEARLPWKAVVATPPEGFGQRLDEMLDWCRMHCPSGGWFALGARFSFAGQADRDAFAEAFKHLSPALEDPPAAGS